MLRVNDPLLVVTYATPPTAPLTVNLKSLFEPGVTRVHAPDASCAAIQIGALDAQKFHATLPPDVGAAVTTALTVVLAFDTPVPVPLIVTAYVPAGVAAVVAMVSVDVVPVALVGFSVAVRPAG